METVKEFLGKDRLERIDMIDKLKEQLRLFPDPTLGLSDLREFGYARGDMFPIRKNAAVELLGTGTITVYALSEDGRRDIVDSVAENMPGCCTWRKGHCRQRCELFRCQNHRGLLELQA